VTQPVENSVYVAPSQTIPGAVPIRQILTLEFNPATGVFTQVNTEVVAVADPLTSLTVRLATSEQMEDVIKLLRANNRALVALLNELGGRETAWDEDDFLNAAEEGG
jgi:hypothetical protein